jgi:hypothetical protein
VVAVCVSVCCCQLAGGQVGRHIWSPCRLTIFCARCCPSAGGQIGSHIWSPSWLSVSPCVAAGCPAANLEATFGRRRGCLCICVPLPAGQGPHWKPHSVDELLVCVLLFAWWWNHPGSALCSAGIFIDVGYALKIQDEPAAYIW